MPLPARHVRALPACLAAALICAFAPVAAQGDYPNRTVRIIAPQAPGGGVDLVGRIMADRLSRALGVAVVIDNHTGASGRAHVVSAKAALGGLTRALAHDLAEFGITVNCVAPGMIKTVREGAAPGHHGGRGNLAGRRGRPDEVAGAVLWLAGKSGRYVTGQTIQVNGGAYLAG